MNNRQIERRYGIHPMFSSVAVVLLLPLLLWPALADALGFGSLTLKSHLNQRLNASVPLLISTTENLDRVKVELAGAAEYRQLGLPWHKELELLKLELFKRSSAQPLIQLSSRAAINAPILSIVLKASKQGRGTYFRHFQLLLDPADLNTIEQRPPQTRSVRDSSEQFPVEQISNSDEEWARIWRYGPVRSGDNLSEIAYRLRKDKRYSNKQVMLSLYQKNPDSFVNRDINRLKLGSWLDVPKGEVVKQYGSRSATAKIDRLVRSKRSVAQKKNTKQQQAVQSDNQKLKYSGRISLNQSSTSAASDKTRDAERVASLKKLESIHQEVMGGKLQMTELGKTVATLGKSMTDLKQEMRALKRDVKSISVNMKNSQPASESMNYWMIAFFLLLVSVLVGLVIWLSRKRQTARMFEEQSLNTIESQMFAPQEEQHHEPVKVQESNSNSGNEKDLDPLFNGVEESLGQCDFDQAELLLEKLDNKAPASLRVGALKAQLYHETGRFEQRNALINSFSESSDSERWDRFCHYLPADVWNACFGDSAGHENLSKTEGS